jgi:hypothetical protein
MVAWPNTLPLVPLVQDYQEKKQSHLTRTEMDSGHFKVRAKTTKGLEDLTLGYYMTAAQIDILEAFYEVTLGNGVLAFDYMHPRRGESVRVRFKNEPAVMAVNGFYFKVEMRLEVLP